MNLYEHPWPDGEYRFFQLGFVVDDLFAAAEHWARVFGVGPFHVLPRLEQPCTYRGADTGVDVQIAVAQAGPAQIELIKQYCDRPSVYRELTAEGPCAFHQVCTVTRNSLSPQAGGVSLNLSQCCEPNVSGPAGGLGSAAASAYLSFTMAA